MNHDDGDKARQSDNHDDDNGEKSSEEDDVDQNVEGGAKFWTFTVAGDKGGHCNQEKS